MQIPPDAVVSSAAADVKLSGRIGKHLDVLVLAHFVETEKMYLR